MTWLHVHWVTIASVAGIWALVASFLNRVPALTPDVQSPPWKRLLHMALIDWPAMLPKVNFVGAFGLPVNVPYLSISKPGPDTPASDLDLLETEPKRNDLVRMLPFMIIGSLALHGCGALADGLRQACTVTDVVITSGYQSVVVWDHVEESQIRTIALGQPEEARKQLEAHKAELAKVFAVLDRGVSDKRKLCAQAWDESAKLDWVRLTAAAVQVAADVAEAIKAILPKPTSLRAPTWTRLLRAVV